MKKMILFLTLLLVIPACGTGLLDRDSSLALDIENARAPEGLDAAALAQIGTNQALSVKNETGSSPLVVTQFRVTVTGTGISEPIVVTAEGTATRLEASGIPIGEGRTVLIEGLNSEREVLRRRLIEGVSVSSGPVKAIKTSLHTVPVILNIRNGGMILANNFSVKGFGEPGTSLSVEAQSETQTASVSLNESAGVGVVVSPSLSTGLFEFSPPITPLGKQTIILTDEGTGESSSKTVTIVQAEDRPGVRLTAAGQLGPTVSLGTGGASRGSHFPLVLKALSKQLKDRKDTAEVSP